MGHKIQIEIFEDGNVETRFEFAADQEITTQDVGIALSSATKVAAISFQKAIKAAQGANYSLEQLEAQIADCYNQDLQEGDKGESETTELEG